MLGPVVKSVKGDLFDARLVFSVFPFVMSWSGFERDYDATAKIDELLKDR